jgi:hypothetical protein
MTSANHTIAEQLGHESALDLLDRLLACHCQGEASPLISDFMIEFGHAPKKDRRAVAAGIATALVDVLMTGLVTNPYRRATIAPSLHISDTGLTARILGGYAAP